MEKMNFNYMENIEDRITFCLKDYFNEFIAIEFTFFSLKIEGVRDLF